jgi:hypothetical protein
MAELNICLIYLTGLDIYYKISYKYLLFHLIWIIVNNTWLSISLICILDDNCTIGLSRFLKIIFCTNFFEYRLKF